MKEIYSIIAELSQDDKRKLLEVLPEKQKELFAEVLRQVSKHKFPNFGYYVQKLKNISQDNPNYRKEYQAMFGIKRSLLNKLKDWKRKQELPSDMPPDVSEAWRCYLWARHLYEKMEWEASLMWVKKAIFHAYKENELNLWFQAKILYYFLIDIEEEPPKLKDIAEEYELLIRSFLVNIATWIMNVYNPAAYTQEKSKQKLDTIANEIKALINNFDLSQENMEWANFINNILYYYSHMYNSEIIDDIAPKKLNEIYNFLMEKQMYKYFPVPSKLVRYMLWDTLIIFKYREGYVEEMLNETYKLLHEVDEKHPYYERIALNHMLALISNGRFSELKQFANKLISEGIAVEHSIYHYYVATLFLGNWTPQEEKDIVAFINRDKVIYSSYGRQLRLRNQALFFFHKQDIEGLEVVIKTYRNSSYKDKKWDALYNFCYILHLTAKLLKNPPADPTLKINKIKSLIKEYGNYHQSAKWIRNHHNIFLNEKVIPMLEKVKV